MKRIFFTAVLFFTGNALFAQCPTISVHPDKYDYNEGEQIMFSVNTDAKTDVTYNWSVSAGSISSGQGTPAITIDSKGLADQSVTATVDLGGLSRDCSSSSSSTVTVNKAPEKPKKAIKAKTPAKTKTSVKPKKSVVKKA